MWFLQFMFGFMSFEFWFLCGLWVDFFILFGFLFLCSFGLISLCPSVLISCFCLDFSVSVFFWVLIFVLFRLWFLYFLLLFQTRYYPTDPTYSTDDPSCRFQSEHMIGCRSILCSPELIRSGANQPQTWSNPTRGQS